MDPDAERYLARITSALRRLSARMHEDAKSRDALRQAALLLRTGASPALAAARIRFSLDGKAKPEPHTMGGPR